jgi:hypothetical protein
MRSNQSLVNELKSNQRVPITNRILFVMIKQKTENLSDVGVTARPTFCETLNCHKDIQITEWFSSGKSPPSFAIQPLSFKAENSVTPWPQFRPSNHCS